jgi:hypothetical protein
MQPSESTVLNVNSASEGELSQLPRVGADTARRIVHYRAIRRGFRDWGDFAAVLGISEEDVMAIRAKARIGPFTESTRTESGRKRTVRGPALPRRPRRLGSW